MWRRLVGTKRRMAVCIALLVLLECGAGAICYRYSWRITAEGMLNPLDPRQVNVERKPEDWRVEVSVPKENAKRLRRPENARGELRC